MICIADEGIRTPCPYGVENPANWNRVLGENLTK
jgi:hypothetical protein